MDVFYALARLRVKERVSLSSVQCALSPRQFYVPSFHSVERQRRVSIVLRYTNNHHHPYIDSTIVLSDKEELKTVVRELLACTQPNRHETSTALWNPYRRVSLRGDVRNYASAKKKNRKGPSAILVIRRKYTDFRARLHMPSQKYNRENVVRRRRAASASIRRHGSDVYLGMAPVQNGGSCLMYQPGPGHTRGRADLSEPLGTQCWWHFDLYSVRGNAKFVPPMYKHTPMPPLIFVTGLYTCASRVAKPAAFSSTAERFPTSSIRSISQLNPEQLAKRQKCFSINQLASYS